MARTFTIVVNNRSFTVEVGDLSHSPVTVLVDGEPFQVELEGVPFAPRRQIGEAQPSPPPQVSTPPRASGPTPPTPSPGPAASATNKTLTAPMPGKILAIKVRPGDAVQVGDEVCVLEAMKMQQIIKSTQSGVVRAVLVQEGQMVSFGDTLIAFQ